MGKETEEQKEVVLDFSKVYPEGVTDPEDRKAWEEEGREPDDRVGGKRRFGIRGR